MVILSLPVPNNTVQTFSGAKDSFLGRFLFMVFTVLLVVNIVKAMFKSIFLSLTFTPCCKYTYSKNNVKFLKLTSSELRQGILKLNRIAAASTCWFIRQPFSTIFHVKFFVQVLRSLKFSRLLHWLQ